MDDLTSCVTGHGNRVPLLSPSSFLDTEVLTQVAPFSDSWAH